MLDCDHVFCIQCLQDFYTDAITGGDLASVRCLEPGCAKKREEALSTGRRRKPKTNISPSELLQIPLEQTLVRRYVTLKHKAGLESDKNTVYCPRKWCQGAARSKKHRKPVEFENVEDEDEEEDAESNKPVMARGDLLCICEDCSFAFCSRCFQGWHGEVFSCTPRRDTGELNEEDKASIEYLKLHTTPCPTCAAPAQKTHGCNHMICFRCNSHFCYLCSSWLEPGNPYKHFNVETTGCYMRLWELENGDGDNVDYGFAGGLRDNMLDPEELVIPDEQMEQAAEADIPPAFVPLAVPFAREGPLVLRIGQLPQRPVPPAAPPAPRAPLRGRRRRGLGGGGGRPVGQRRVGIDPAEAAGLPLQRVDVEELDARQQAWVQRFVEMALNDEEHLMEDD
jgi:E3 ubiquitin-protein ligase RNF14